jgi:hypothetical protein
MNIEEHIRQMETEFLNHIVEGVSDAMEEIGIDVASRVKNRIREEGIDDNYSNKKTVPAYLLAHKATNKTKAKAWVKKKYKSDEPLANWKELREVMGLKTDAVNLTYTGQMFRNLKQVQVSVDGFRILARIKGIDKATKDKLKWNKERYRNFLTMTKQEKEHTKMLIKNRLREIIK